MKLKTLTLSGVALGTLIAAALAIPAGAQGLFGAQGAVGGAVGGTVGGVGGGAGITNGLGGPVGATTNGATVGAAGSVGTQTDIGAPSARAGLGTSAGASANGPAVGIGNSEGVQTTTPGGSASIGAGAGASAVPVVSLPNAGMALSQATVQSRDGAAIGTIDGVKMGPDGKPSTVQVSLADSAGGASRISLMPDQLTFDQSNKTAVSSLSQAEIDSLAAAQR